MVVVVEVVEVAEAEEEEEEEGRVSWAQGTQWEKRSLHRWSSRPTELHFVSAAHAQWALRDPLEPLADMSAF